MTVAELIEVLKTENQKLRVTFHKDSHDELGEYEVTDVYSIVSEDDENEIVLHLG